MDKSGGGGGADPKWSRYLNRIYHDPREPGSFQSVNKLKKTTQTEGRYQLGKNRLQRWLQNQEHFSQNRLYLPKAIKHSRVIVGGLYDQFDADLADYISIADSNDGTQYLLLVIDIFSRYVWIEPLKNKTNSDVIDGFEKIFRQGYIPRRLRTDQGTEFLGQIMQPFYKHYNITHFVSYNDQKANYAERAIKTIKSKLGRYMAYHHSGRYIDSLEDIVHSYNATHHASIGMPPDQVTPDNEDSVWWMQYRPKKAQQHTPQRFRFNVGDNVRIPHLSMAFGREYRSRWTQEIFIITQRFHRDGINVYNIEDGKKEEIYGTFYEGELQLVLQDQNNQWTVESIVNERGGGDEDYRPHEALVKFKGWPSFYNRWIPYDTAHSYLNTVGAGGRRRK